jgi:uncharacterized protein YwgA
LKREDVSGRKGLDSVSRRGLGCYRKKVLLKTERGKGSRLTMKARGKRRVSARKLTVLLLLEARGPDRMDRAPIAGTTRMQKLVVLVREKSKDFLADDETFEFDFDYRPDKYGPADLDLYQDLELLKAAGWLEINGESGVASKEPSGVLEEVGQGGQPLLPEDEEETEISFEYLMGERSEEIELAEAEREFEKEYRITEKGVNGLEEIGREGEKREKLERLREVCGQIKRDYAGWPLTLLLRHVYTAYPETTVRSEIRRQVLR